MPLAENDRKEQLSYAYVHTLAARAGFSCDRPGIDRQSMDMIIHSEGRMAPDSLFEQAQIGLQLKATSCEPATGDTVTFPLPIKNYNDLRRMNLMPRHLVVFHMPVEIEEWLDHEVEEYLSSRRCAYYLNLCGAPEVANETRRTVHIPRANVLTVESLTALMEQSSRGGLYG